MPNPFITESDKSTEKTIKDCPFCGNRIYGVMTDKHDTTFWIECRKCGMKTVQSSSIKLVEERWNRRV